MGPAPRVRVPPNLCSLAFLLAAVSRANLGVLSVGKYPLGVGGAAVVSGVLGIVEEADDTDGGTGVTLVECC